MFTGRRPFCFRCASTALKCMNTWPLSSADAARVDLAVADRRLERRRLPQLQRIDRLHVVVAVEQDRRRASARRASRRRRPDCRASRSSRTFCRPMRRISSAHHSAQRLTSSACSGQRADARNREQRLQLLEISLAVDVDEVDDVVHVARVISWSRVSERSHQAIAVDQRPVLRVLSFSRCARTFSRAAGISAGSRPS